MSLLKHMVSSFAIVIILFHTTISFANDWTDGAWTIVNGQKQALNKEGDSYHIVTNANWPATIGVEAEWSIGPKKWGSTKVAFICTDASLTASDGSPEQPATIEPISYSSYSSSSHRRNYRISANGVTNNPSVNNSVIYHLQANCRSKNPDPHPKPGHEYKSFTYSTTFVVDANGTSDWQPLVPSGEPHYLTMMAPQEGARLKGELELKLRNNLYGMHTPSYLDVEIKKAGKVEYGTHGEMSLPEGQPHGSQWETVLTERYPWPESQPMWIKRPGLAEPGLYEVTVTSAWNNGNGSDANGAYTRTFQIVGSVSVQKAKMVTKTANENLRPAGKPAGGFGPPKLNNPSQGQDNAAPATGFSTGIGPAKLNRATASLIVVDTISVHPTPLKEGTPVNLEINFKNNGSVASYAAARYQLTCTVVQGSNDCPVPSRTAAIGEAIEPGQTASVILMGAKPASAGQYRVSVSPLPASPGRSFSVTLNVAGSRVTSPSPGLRVSPAASPSQTPAAAPATPGTVPVQPGTSPTKPRLVSPR